MCAKALDGRQFQVCCGEDKFCDVTSLLFLEENVPNEETHEMGEFLMYSMNAQKNKFCDNVSKRNIQKDVELFITKN